MAGDWIKMRCALADDPAVIQIAAALDVEEDLVVGKLHRIWSWADQQLRIGNAAGVTKAWLDRYVNLLGFADCMVGVGWLAIDEAGIRFPNFERHNLKTGKDRALSAVRTAKHRGKTCNDPSVTKPLPEKRREEKRRKEKKEDSGGVPAHILKARGEQEWVGYPSNGPALWLTRDEASRLIRKFDINWLKYWADQFVSFAQDGAKYRKKTNHNLTIQNWHRMRLEDGRTFAPHPKKGWGYWKDWDLREAAKENGNRQAQHKQHNPRGAPTATEKQLLTMAGIDGS